MVLKPSSMFGFALLCLFIVNLSVVVCNDLTFPCTLPNGEEGVCMFIFSCPEFLAAATNNDTNALRYLEGSSCNQNHVRHSAMVCCKITQSEQNKYVSSSVQMGSSIESPEEIEARRRHVVEKILPKTEICGRQQLDDHHIIGGVAEIDEYPWTVDIKLKFGNLSSCVGALISRRFVLTSAFCDIFADRVRLGLYESDKSVSCKGTPDDDLYECTDSVIEMGFVTVATNPDFGLTLLALAKNVTYTTYIRPICLPLDESTMAQTENVVFTTGWGVDDEAVGQFKKKNQFQLHNKGICERVKSKISMPDQLVCGIPWDPTDNCFSDNGSPIMHRHRSQWYLYGVQTHRHDRKFISEGCTTRFGPILGIKMTGDILNWILDNLTA